MMGNISHDKNIKNVFAFKCRRCDVGKMPAVAVEYGAFVSYFIYAPVNRFHEKNFKRNGFCIEYPIVLNKSIIDNFLNPQGERVGLLLQ
jgi:hypothetical protein